LNAKIYIFWKIYFFIVFNTGNKTPNPGIYSANTLWPAQAKQTLFNPLMLSNNPVTMKNSVFSFSALLILGLIFFSSCKKDATFEQQLAGTWTSTKVTYGTEDGTLLYNYDLVLQSSKEFDLTEKTLLGTSIHTGVWASDAGTQEVTLTDDDGASQTKYDITNLTETEMTAETVINKIRFKIVFKKK
jgi:hypothetical protein